MNAKRLLALILAAMMLTFTVACGKDPVQPDAPDTTAAPAGADTPPAPETTESPYDANGYIKDDLPRDLTFAQNGNPTDFTILGWEHALPEFEVAEETGDVINDSIYKRNRAVEERLGVKLGFIIIPGNNANVGPFCTAVQNSINTNSSSYDAVGGYPRSPGALALNGMLLDLLDQEYLNFDQPWWSKMLVEQNTLRGRLYFASGDIAPTLLFQMMFMIYNNDLGTDLGMTNPQELAIEGKWTQDKMFEMIANVYSDIDSDGKKSEKDQFGLFSIYNPNLDIFYMGAGMRYLKSDENGQIVISDDYFSEKNLSIVDRFIALYKSNDGYTSNSISSTQVFAEGYSLLYNVTGKILYETVRHSDMAYSILPAPKYNEAQEDYYTCLAFTHTQYCLPIDVRDAAMSSAVLECMASEGYRRTTPAIFETAFKYQYSNSENDSILFDKIRSGVVYDLARPFHDEMGGDGSAPVTTWRSQIVNGNNGLGVVQAAFMRMWQKKLDSINERIPD